MSRGAILIFLVFCPFLAWSQTAAFRENTVIFKVDAQYKALCGDHEVKLENLAAVMEALQPEVLMRKFPHQMHKQHTRSVVPGQNKPLPDITLIYEFRYKADVSVFKVIKDLMNTGVCEYAEPAMICSPAVVPSDQLLGKQWHLEKINAFEAWETDTGSADIIIGVIDTGVDWDHPDLVDALRYNEQDPIDGEDNDSNGYVDDYRGWNFYDNNNDPNELSWSHGTHVAGLACASTNNDIGVAGTSYSSKVLAIKAGDKLELTHGYEGIIYAVENGADIINCSWGNTTYTSFGHDIVKYAAGKGKLVVCGAGNNNNDYDFYPASFPEAMSVGATDSADNKAVFSSYNYHIDIVAPGQVVYSTKNGTYDYDNGTSMSSPIVAGAAALVKHRFPGLTPPQIIEQLRTTADDIYGVGNNDIYKDQLGTGRLNMKRALDSIYSSAIRLDHYEITDNADEAYVLGDEVELSIELVNHLKPSGAVEVTVRPLDHAVVMLDSTHVFPALGTGERSNNFNAPFRFRIDKFTEYNQEMVLQLNISDGVFSSREYVKVLINPDFVNVLVNDIASTVSSVGLFGYTDYSQRYGLGFRLENQGNLLFEGGLMIGQENNKRKRVADRLRAEDYGDRDFWQKEVISRGTPAAGEAFYASGIFTDTSAARDEIGLEVRQQVQAYDKPGHRNYMVLTYVIKNTGAETLSDIYVGLFADWDITRSAENRGATVFSKRLAYVYYTGEEQLSAGIQLLSPSPFFSNMIDNVEGGNGGVDINDENGFSSDDKYRALTENRYEAGEGGKGTDVVHVVSTGGLHLVPGDSIAVSFAVMAARNSEALLNTADSAYRQFNGYAPGENVFAEFQMRGLFPNPTSGAVVVEFDLKYDAEIKFTLYNTLGNIHRVLGESLFYSGSNRKYLELPELPTGIYFLNIEAKNFTRTLPLAYLRP